LNGKFLDLGASEFVAEYGGPALNAKFDEFGHVEAGSVLYKEFDQFVSQYGCGIAGPMRSRCGWARVPSGTAVEVTDVTLKEGIDATWVHELKSRSTPSPCGRYSAWRLRSYGGTR
jgi:hypothetical protein